MKTNQSIENMAPEKVTFKQEAEQVVRFFSIIAGSIAVYAVYELAKLQEPTNYRIALFTVAAGLLVKVYTEVRK